MALALIDLRGHRGPLSTVLPRPPDGGADVRESVASIIARVRQGGDEALRALTAELDGVVLDELRVPDDQIAAAGQRIAPELRSALEVAFERITAYHAHELTVAPEFHAGGVVVRDLARPVE